MEADDRRLEAESEQRFLDLFGHLLVYVNDQFGVLDEVDTYEDLTERNTDDLLPLRNTLYEESTEDLITEFVAENPAALSEADLQQVDRWTDYVVDDFVVVRLRQNDAIFLDTTEPPRAYAVKAVRLPFASLWDESALPAPVSGVALLPFEDQIVYDGWVGLKTVLFGGTLSTRIDDEYEEAKHRFGIIDSLPAPEEAEKTDAEQLQFYMKNKRNREQYAEEIEALRQQSADLERIYHQELGKAEARSLGREFRDLSLNEAYVAIYDGRVVTSAPTEQAVREILEDIMPEGKAEHPYIYHFNP